MVWILSDTVIKAVQILITFYIYLRLIFPCVLIIENIPTARHVSRITAAVKYEHVSSEFDIFAFFYLLSLVVDFRKLEFTALLYKL